MKLKPMAGTALMGTPQPYIHGVGNRALEEKNEQFYSRDFKDRHFALKNNSKVK